MIKLAFGILIGIDIAVKMNTVDHANAFDDAMGNADVPSASSFLD